MDELDLLDWKRRIFEVYAEVRADDDHERAWRRWRSVRDELFASHPQTPLTADARSSFAGLPYFDYDPACRVLADVEPAPTERRDIATSGDHPYSFTRFGRATFLLAGERYAASTSTGSTATAVGCTSASRMRRAAASPTEPGGTCSTRSKAPTSGPTAGGSFSTSTSPTTRPARTTRGGSARSRRPGTGSPCRSAPGSATRDLESIRDRALPQVPPPDLRRGGRAGGGRADAHERDRAGEDSPGVPLRRPARHGQDVARAHPGKVGQLRARADRVARQHLPCVRRDHERHVARRDRDGRRVAARHRRHPRHPRPRRAAAGRGDATRSTSSTRRTSSPTPPGTRSSS